MTPKMPLASATKLHFRDLDILRGIASFSVLIMHLGDAFQVVTLPRAYLAVDFFFVLSGFVVAYAYEERLRGGYSFRLFLLQRVIRLYPLVVLGAVIGAVGAAVRLAIIREPIDYQLLGAFISGIFLIPSAFLQDAGNGSYFPLNNPTWSLFWEMFVSVLFGLSASYLRRQVMIPTLCVGLLLFVSGQVSGMFYNGWSVNNFWFGSIRVTFLFLVGMLLFRYRSGNRLVSVRISPVVLSLILIVVFAIPSYDVLWSNSLDCVVIIGLFPFLVAAGSHGRPDQGRDDGNILGRLSYPVYVLQFPFVRVLGHWSRDHSLPAQTSYVLLIVAGLLLVGGSWLVLVVYDEPVRSRLRRHVRQLAQAGRLR